MKSDFELTTALEDLQYKYVRLEALVSIMQQFTAECVDVIGTLENGVSNSLYEIELGLQDANKKFKDILDHGRMVSKETREQRVKSA